jgi:hypothetical protein
MAITRVIARPKSDAFITSANKSCISDNELYLQIEANTKRLRTAADARYLVIQQRKKICPMD